MFFQLLLLLLVAKSVVGQSTAATCLPGWEWSFNSRGQNPCLVSAYILGVCEGGGYTIDALPPDYHYPGPTKLEDNYCECSTVAFSLVSACGLCQNREIEPWSTWSFNCSKIYPQEFVGDIPLGTSIPAWAYLNVISTDIFNPANAQAHSGSPESSAVSSKPTGTSTQTATSTQGASKKTNIGPIVGGAVGGVVGLLLLIGTVVTIIYVTRRRQKRAHTAASTSYLDTPQMGSTTQYDAASRFSHAPTTLQKAYDPSDPSTFPSTPMSPNSIYTTGSPVPMLGYTGHPEPGHPGLMY